MSFSINSGALPRIASFAEAKKHYDSVRQGAWSMKPIKGRYRERERHFAMRELADGSIVFRFYDTDCVTYHPDGDVTIVGWPSMSTTAFINALAPPGIDHGQGQFGCEPILYLYQGSRWGTWENDAYVPNKNPVHIVRADGVRLHYCAERGWLPAEPDELTQFTWPIVDARLARAASRRYNFGAFLAAAPAIDALTPIERFNPSDENCALDRMEKRDFATALAFCPRGVKKTMWGRSTGEPTALCSNFVRRMRTWIYEEAGAVSKHSQGLLTSSEYEQYKRNEKLYG